MIGYICNEQLDEYLSISKVDTMSRMKLSTNDKIDLIEVVDQILFHYSQTEPIRSDEMKDAIMELKNNIDKNLNYWRN